MKEKNSPSAVMSEANSPEASQSSTEENVQRHWQRVVKRRSFLKGLGIAGAALSAKRGETRKSELKGASRDMYESMSEKQLEEFAETKRKGLAAKKS